MPSVVLFMEMFPLTTLFIVTLCTWMPLKFWKIRLLVIWWPPGRLSISQASLAKATQVVLPVSSEDCLNATAAKPARRVDRKRTVTWLPLVTLNTSPLLPDGGVTELSPMIVDVRPPRGVGGQVLLAGGSPSTVMLVRFLSSVGPLQKPDT